MSQAMSTVLVSCGLMVGWNIAPPPPGPMTRKSPGRSAKAEVKQRTTRIAGRMRSFIGSCGFPRSIRGWITTKGCAAPAGYMQSGRLPGSLGID